MTSSYIQALADTAAELFAGGRKDLRLVDITKAYFRTLSGPLPPGSALLPSSQVTSLQSALNDNLMEKGHQVCPVAEKYYTKYRRRIPEDTPSVRECLPTGTGKKIFGLRLITGEDDEARLWITWQGTKEKRAVNAVVNVGVRVDGAHKQGLVNAAQADGVIKPGRDLVSVAFPEFLEELEAPEAFKALESVA